MFRWVTHLFSDFNFNVILRASFHLYLLFVFIVAHASIHQTTPELLPQLEVTLRPRRIPIAGLFTILWYYPGFILPGAPYYSAPASYYTGTLTHCRVIGNTIQRNSIDSSQIGADSFHGLGWAISTLNIHGSSDYVFVICFLIILNLF